MGVGVLVERPFACQLSHRFGFRRVRQELAVRILRVVGGAEEAIDAYRELLGDPGAAEAMGRRARERVLDEHTYAHRARRLLELVGISSGAAAPVGA